MCVYEEQWRGLYLDEHRNLVKQGKKTSPMPPGHGSRKRQLFRLCPPPHLPPCAMTVRFPPFHLPLQGTASQFRDHARQARYRIYHRGLVAIPIAEGEHAMQSPHLLGEDVGGRRMATAMMARPGRGRPKD